LKYELFDMRTGKTVAMVPRPIGRLLIFLLIRLPWFLPHHDIAEGN
jgi:hypothetical protein